MHRETRTKRLTLVATSLLVMGAACSASTADGPDEHGGRGQDGGAADGDADPGTTVQPGTPAALGEPTGTLFNDLLTVLDKTPSAPEGAKLAYVAPMPAPLTGAPQPYVPDVKVFVRRDSAVLTFANVAGVADYRAYVVGPDVTFTATTNGPQPRGAVVACAGYRQHTYQSEVRNGHRTRELLQAIEIPGLTKAGSYTVVLEALTTPCPFVGMPSLADAQITMDNDGKTTKAHLNAGESYHYTGIPAVVFKSFATRTKEYGNLILNGQGASISYTKRESEPWIGLPVKPNDPVMPSDPKVIARSALRVDVPEVSASKTVPNIDVGPHALTDDFNADHEVAPAAMAKSPDYEIANGYSINPVFQMNTWSFWGRYMQAADAVPGTSSYNFWTPDALKTVQVFSRLGRLFTTFGDAGADVGGTLGFASLVAPIVELDSQKYIHSVFRMNSDASHRRYWWWTLCGGATSDELFDTTKKAYKVRPTVFETTFSAGGNNPSVPDHHTLASATTPDDAVGIAKECLTITEEGRSEDPFRADGTARAGAAIRAMIHPKNKSHGSIILGTPNSDGPALNADPDGFRFRLDAAGNRIGPMIEPYDQIDPLAQYDVFVRPDRLVVFLNGRPGFCVDLSTTPLSMKYAMIVYGDLLYHSGVEWQELSEGASNKDSQMYQYLLNTPTGASRTWDMIGHSDRVDIPAAFGNVDPGWCRKPVDSSVRGYRP